MDNDTGFINYNPQGDYAGADNLLSEEWKHIKFRRKNFNQDNIKGLALSGGGIRSASFCLGVLQALAVHTRLEKFDYLSTVSGGGYLGGALSWLWSDKWKDSAQSQDFGTTSKDFPFGASVRDFRGDDDARTMNRQQASLLRHLRQHGKYLIPGRGINALSLFSIVLRSITMGFVSLMVFSSLIFSALYTVRVFGEACVSPVLIGLMGLAVLSYLVLHFRYMITIANFKNKTTGGEEGSEKGRQESYQKRRWFEKTLPIGLYIIIALGILSSIHAAQVYMTESALQVGGVSALLGAAFGAIGKESKWRAFLGKLPHSFQMMVGAVLMVFGLLVLADSLVAYLAAQTAFHLVIFLPLAYVIYKLAEYLPINNISIHRYYRDRLMETFMPDVEKVLSGDDDGEALKANETKLHQLIREELNPDDANAKEFPFHIINTNIILVESEIAKFRGRGGDNFILTPLYSGSNATGWRSTEEFCAGDITLPSAVAISGAAANPNAGVAGQGLTTNPVISILMSIFNLRLGYWASNPRYKNGQDETPSYWKPGFWEVVNRNKMNEEASYVQLSDGGHFENLALYELIRRRAKFIVVCDAGADPNYEFADLANAIEKVRVDFGAIIEIDRTALEPLIPQSDSSESSLNYAVSEKSYLLANIDYNDGGEKGQLVYIKTALSKTIPADIHGYKRLNPDFPDQTTADQFFDEIQFEAYRELGWQIVQDMMQDNEAQAAFELMDH